MPRPSLRRRDPAADGLELRAQCLVFRRVFAPRPVLVVGQAVFLADGFGALAEIPIVDLLDADTGDVVLQNHDDVLEGRGGGEPAGVVARQAKGNVLLRCRFFPALSLGLQALSESHEPGYRRVAASDAPQPVEGGLEVNTRLSVAFCHLLRPFVP